MKCLHSRGDFVGGSWLCADCLKFLDERPKVIIWVNKDGSLGEVKGGDFSGMRQDVVAASIAMSDTMSLSKFIEAMAKWFIFRAKMDKATAIEMSIDCLRNILPDTFGHQEYG